MGHPGGTPIWPAVLGGFAVACGLFCIVVFVGHILAGH
jgi:hypothetical protein